MKLAILIFINFLIFVVLGLGVFTLLNIQSAQNPENHQAHLLNIRARLDAGGALEMQRLFPEGAFFSYVWYADAWLNLASSSENYGFKQQAVSEANWALVKLRQPEIVNQFSKPTQIENGIFYSGWTNLLRGKILALKNEGYDPELEKEFHDNSAKIAEAFSSSPVPILSSYPQQAWPVDNLPALSSLLIHDQLFGTAYERDIVKPWVENVSHRYQLETQLLPHNVDAENGEVIKTARGESTGLAAVLWQEIDSEIASFQYRLYAREFVRKIGPVVLVNEYQATENSSVSHNSGPVINGYGATATVVGLAAAKTHHNEQNETGLMNLTTALGLPLPAPVGKQYLLGKLLIYDILVTWGHSIDSG